MPPAEDPNDVHARLLEGVKRFRREVFPQRQELFADLATRQAPHTLFITCADSRVSPTMITQTQPGELFVLRNIGNIVPSYGEMLGGVSAVIEYACEALNVGQIVICGHSDCGAMKALLAPEDEALERMPTVRTWLRNAQAARSVVEVLEPQPEDMVQALVEQNVRLQLAHLRTHPSVAKRLATGSLSLHGWVYGIHAGSVSVFDAAEQHLTVVDPARE